MNSFSFETTPQHLAGAIRLLQHIPALSIPTLSDKFRLALLKEARQYPLREISNYVGSGRNKVRQEMFLQDQLNLHGLFGQLTEEFQTLFDQSVAGTEFFSDGVIFNDWIIQKYEPGSAGITPHRDRTDYRHMICLFVLAGHGRFFVSDDREKTNQREIANLPGDVILMPGPGFKFLERRPFHYLEDITEERWIFGLRHDESKLNKNTI